MGQHFLTFEAELQWSWIQTKKRNPSSAQLGANVEAVPDHEQDGQQQDADVREVTRVDLHRDRLASNGAPASGQSKVATISILVGWNILNKFQESLPPAGTACENPHPK